MRKMENFKPTQKEKRLGIKQPILFTMGVKQPKPRYKISHTHFEKQFSQMGSIEKHPQKWKKEIDDSVGGKDASPMGN